MASLDQSLDDIVSSRRKEIRKGARPVKGRKGTRVSTRQAAGSVSSGIRKSGKATGPKPVASASTALHRSSGISKAMISNLPTDVSEMQVKDFFTQSVGPVKKVQLTYGPDGRSRGSALIIFNKPESAALAMEKHNGVKVDDKPMRIEVLVDAQTAKPVQRLNERISAQNTKSNGRVDTDRGAKPKTGPRGRRGEARGPKPQRRKPKTADELDAEMVDYFEAPTPTAAATAAPAAAAPEVVMDVQ